MITSLNHFSVYFYSVPSSPRGTMILWPSVLQVVDWSIDFSVQQALCVCHWYQSCVYFAHFFFFMGLEIVYWISGLEFFLFFLRNQSLKEGMALFTHQLNVPLFLLVCICGSKSPILVLSCSFEVPCGFLKQSNVFLYYITWDCIKLYKHISGESTGVNQFCFSCFSNFIARKVFWWRFNFHLK